MMLDLTITLFKFLEQTPYSGLYLLQATHLKKRMAWFGPKTQTEFFWNQTMSDDYITM
jgi:hypothetical protein